jgi:transposase
MYRIHLSEEQRQELHQRAHTPGVAPRTRDRLEMVRLSDAGFSIPRIAGHLRISEVCVRSWIKRFLTGGFDALPDQPHLGQQSALTSEILQAIAQQLAMEQQTWTAGQIADWVAERYGIQRSTKQMSRMLTRAKLSYKRTHRSLKHKQNPEEVAQKKRELSILEKGGRGSAGSVSPR